VPPFALIAILLVLTACPASLPGPPPGGDDASMPAPAGGDTHTPAGSCSVSTFLHGLGKERLLVGASMSDATAAAAPGAFTLRYQYIAGGLFDQEEACTSCTAGCTARGVSCGKGCGWWGCWQDTRLAPGQYVRDFVRHARERGQVPMLTYYQILPTTRVREGTAEVEALADVGLMRRYYSDWRLVLQSLGEGPVLLHVEPDFWGYAQQHSRALGKPPSGIPAAVASANPTDCAALPNSLEGFGRCLVAMVRRYAPEARVAFQASAWGSGFDAHRNRDTSLDVAAEARKTADFMLACGADETDYIVVEASDRDAAWYQVVQHEDYWWDISDATLPNYRQALAWAKALSERMEQPHLWWQLPVGNMSLPNVDEQWQDNRVEGFFARMPQVAAAHGVGVAFGSGQPGQTTPETDGDFLLSKAREHAASGGQAPCP
jgi:hypothetical protein